MILTSLLLGAENRLRLPSSSTRVIMW